MGLCLVKKNSPPPSLSHGSQSQTEQHNRQKVGSHQACSGPLTVCSDGALPNRNDPKPRVSPTDQDPLRDGLTNRTRKAGSHQPGGTGLTNVSSEGALLRWKHPKPRVSPTDRDPTKGTQALSY
ncbi:hypothetical protein CgunFtcFv8_010049 [Champsocephalus gunnari]|uniref:Uncharacterized protein n=1 Tax=Champsocephalus gunnari TaxID=52237 RepID=A0AAN8E009_CHAGU|nr:hypothetical protein CgunFtcFv8_010049 [Champsocephalus gunnari]